MEIREVIFLLFDVCRKLLKSGVVINGSVELHNPQSFVASMVIVLLVITVLYTLPKTILAGLILLLLTVFLDGFMATDVHVKHLNNIKIKNIKTVDPDNAYLINYQFIFKFKN